LAKRGRGDFPINVHSISRPLISHFGLHLAFACLREAATAKAGILIFDMFGARMASKQIVQEEKDIEIALNQICEQLLNRHPQLSEMVLVGIRTGGVFLAERLKQKILQKRGIDLPTGIIDITLYRDDWTRLSQTPEVKKTEIHFSIGDKDVLLVDDVLFTGRTIRAAIDALLDLGRPRRVELAVLIDRGHRELPISADYIGKTLEVSKQDSVNVELKELAGVDQVVIEYGKYPKH
jgi:pyrimidine operon attenuation protein/uracil phosphoribosyltransferase